MSAEEVDAKERITPEDIEGALRSLGSDTSEAVTEIRGKLFVVGAAAVVVVILSTFWLGRARGKKRTTIVEIRRV